MPLDEGSGGCSPGIFKVSREHCSNITNTSSPCSLSRINTTLQNAGYNIPITMTDFDCSTLQPIHVEEHSLNISQSQIIIDGLLIPRLTNFSISKPSSRSFNVSWNNLPNTKEIKQYGILWRKIVGADSSSGETNYQHIHSTKKYYIFNNISTANSQYEVLITAIGQDGIPQLFTTVNFLSKSFCPGEEVGSPDAYGIFQWPETPVGNVTTLACPYNNQSIASRDCFSTSETESGGSWGAIVVTKCKYKDSRSKDLFILSQNEVNSSNVVNITKELRDLSSTNRNNTLNPGDIDYIATTLENIALVKEKANEILDDFLTAVDNVLDTQLKNILKSQQNRNSSSRIVETLNIFAESLVIGAEGKIQTAKRNFDINLETVESQNFSGLNFSGIQRRTNQSERRNNILNKQSNEVRHVLSPSLIIPRTIFNESTDKNSSANQTVIFVLYRETKFFRLSLADTSKTKSRLNSLVISGSIEGLSVSNLSVPVNIALPSLERGDTKSIQCSYWDFSAGNWSQEGCKFERVLEDRRVLCSCNHFTNFAMLMLELQGHSSRREDCIHDKILGVISYVGCALSFAGLILTIITILILRDLRNQVPSQILLNFCIALSLTIIVFLAAVEKSRTSSLAGCRAAAIALHYFLLSAFLWMAVEAYNMYWAFVKVFSAPSQSRLLLKCCVFAWGTPFVIVGITMIAALDKYGDGTYCRLQGVPFFVSFLTPTVLIIIGNIVAFCFIIRSMVTSGAKVTSDKKTTGYQQARRGIAIMVLLGLTWLFGILTIGDAKLVFQYLFCIFNTLQGLFVFIFFVVLPTGTRRQLKKLGKRVSYSNRRNLKLQNLGEDSSQFNKNVYSNDITTSTSGALVSTSQNPTLAHPAIEKPLKSASDFDEGNEDIDHVNDVLDQKSPNEVWLNPNLTRYSVRRNGPTYTTTIELTIK
ncbi:adhesion G-protein coupled receptor G6-like [Dendronephthya gigantea]|uniref:adhesion G-protein coupled receptor G6-like n=1 Tax=Dendronephthya gigantea TaxID=151771 RepID=UPI00106D1115|nr:adhesion G-protein coupled receptor G6-like [Dendronephthya gigantea]